MSIKNFEQRLRIEDNYQKTASRRIFSDEKLFANKDKDW